MNPKEKIRACVLCGYGLNCDHETAYAFAQAGASAKRVHINTLIHKPEMLQDFHILTFVGGFSWADDHGAGVIQAVRMKSRLGDAIKTFTDAGKLVIGICNGFQTMVNMGLLPGFTHEEESRCVALIGNECGNFRDDWVSLKVNPDTPCVFTKGFATLEFPVRHGEGKFYAEKPVLNRLESGGHVVLRYTDEKGSPANGKFPDNPNGSINDIAGICDETGRIFGLMPHPEAFNSWMNHPQYTRMKNEKPPGWEDAKPPGIVLFENGVNSLVPLFT